MTAAIIHLDAHRKKVFEQMRCLFCGTEHALVHPQNDHPQAYHGPCPGCDETASVPMWRLRMP